MFYTAAYVLPFYASQSTRPSPTLSRDSTAVIRARVTSVTISTVLSCLVTLVILSSQSNDSDPLQSMGLWPIDFVASLRALLLTAILFAGPLYESLVLDGAWRSWLNLRPLIQVWSEWTRWRNIVVVRSPLIHRLQAAHIWQALTARRRVR